MAEEISDSKFKSDITELLDTVVKKVDGLASDVRTNSFKLDRVETKVDRIDVELKDLKSAVTTLSGQFSDVGVMAIKDHQRIDDLGKRVDDLESEVH